MAAFGLFHGKAPVKGSPADFKNGGGGEGATRPRFSTAIVAESRLTLFGYALNLHGQRFKSGRVAGQN